MNKLMLCAAFAIAAIVCVACAQPGQPQPEANKNSKSGPENAPQKTPETTPDKTAENTPPAEDAEIKLWGDKLLAVAADYRSYQKMAEDPSYGPTMCRAPIHKAAFISQAESGAHGRKLYFLWVKQPDIYARVGWVGRFSDVPKETVITQPVGQVLVKESFVPGKDADPDNPRAPRTLGEKSGLFVMLKLDPSTAGTDQGWVYGTISADGKTVTSAGKVSNCMKCHTDTTHDRMFGMPANGGKANGTTE